MTQELESKVQKKCMDLVRKRGGYIYKNAQSMYTEIGRPDLAACVPVYVSDIIAYCEREAIPLTEARIGLFLGLEIKRLGHLNEVSDAQSIVGRQIEKCGGLWYAVDSTETVSDILDMLGVAK